MSFVFTNTCDGIFNTVDIRFTKKCDNNCSFCIEKKSSIPGNITDIDKIFKAVIENKSKEVLILGGEPFLEIHKLYKFVKKLHKNKIKIYITTSLPYIIFLEYPKFKKILDLIDGLNISIQHYKDQTNTKVLNTADKFNRLFLLKMILGLDSSKIRVCLNLISYVIDTKRILFKAIKYLENMGVKKIKLNELCHSDEYISFEEIMNIKMKSPFSRGCYTKVLEEEFPNINIELKRSCFITEKTLNANFMDIVKIILNRWFVKPLKNKFCVIYEDGTKYNNWK